MLNGKRVCLRPISIKDTEFIIAMRNDLEISKEFFSDPPVYDYNHEKWMKLQNNVFLDFIIMMNDEKIGRIYLYDISFRHQKAEFGIIIINECRGRGFAHESALVLFNYIFTNLPIKKIYLHVFSDNQQALRLYKKLGFQNEGHFKSEFFKNGVWKDVIRMSLFKDTFSGKVT